MQRNNLGSSVRRHWSARQILEALNLGQTVRCDHGFGLATGTDSKADICRMIVLTGISGGLGSGVLDTIMKQKLLPTSEISISAFSQNSQNLAAARAAGIQIRHGDMNKPDTMRESYKGAEALFLVSFPSVGEERYQLHKSAIDAAKDAGVKHIIYTSITMGGRSGESSYAGVMQAHLKTVDYLKSTGLGWTIIREATYAHLWNNFAGFLDLEKAGDHVKVIVSNDRQSHWASRKDLAKGTAKIVANWHEYAGKSIALTGPRLYSVENILSLYAKHTGKTFEIEKVGESLAVKHHKEVGSVPSFMYDFLPNWASWGEALARGEKAYIDPTSEQLLGRRPLTIEDMKDELFGAGINKLDIKDFV